MGDRAERDSAGTIAGSCIAVRLRMLNRVVTGIYDEALRPLGLRVSQLNILVATARLGLARPARLCALLQLDASTLSRNARPLQRRGWLEVVPEGDARAQPLRLTEQGRLLIDQALPAWRQAQRRAAELLGDDALALLDRATARLREDRPSV